MPIEPRTDFDTATLLNEHGGDISRLSERVGKCYSSERYEDFQEATEKIIERFLKSKVGWAAVVWIMTLVGSMLAEKFLHLF